METGPLKAGVAEMELDPPLGLAMGDGAPRAEGSLTPLYAKALVLSNGHAEVAIVTLDMLAIDGPDANRAAELVERRCGVPAGAIIMTCSHTHVAPSMLPTLHAYRKAFGPQFDDEAVEREREWVDVVVERIADAVSRAHDSLRPATLGVATADLPWAVFNRRRHTRNYGVWTHWMGIPPDQAHRPEGPVDPELGVLVVRGADHRPICLLWNMTGHNSFNFGDKYSGDLAYTVQKAIDERTRRHLPTLYTPGCSGNTNYFDYGKPGGLEKATEEVASAIMAVHRDACTLPEVKLGHRSVELMLAQRDTSRNWWKHDVHRKMPAWDEYLPREVERFRDEGRKAYPANVVVLRMGDAAMVGLSGEMFVEFGLMIKERSPFARTFVASYSNGYAGYVATRRAFVGGSYEVWTVLNARVARDGGYLMVDKSVEFLDELYAE